MENEMLLTSPAMAATETILEMHRKLNGNQ